MTEHKPISFFVLTFFLLCSSLCCCVSYNKHMLTSEPTVPAGLAIIPTPTRLTPISLFSYLNNKGIGSAPGQANTDGSGFSYPANQLPQAGQRTFKGVPYQFQLVHHALTIMLWRWDKPSSFPQETISRHFS